MRSNYELTAIEKKQFSEDVKKIHAFEFLKTACSLFSSSFNKVHYAELEKKQGLSNNEKVKNFGLYSKVPGSLEKPRENE